MAKTKTLRKVVDDCAVLLQKLRRLQSADENGNCTCVTCGKVGHWKTFDGGHWISRTYTIHKLEIWNIQAQCKGCNRFDHRIHDDYTLWMIDQYGEDFVREKNEMKYQTYKHDRADIEQRIKDYKQMIKDLECTIIQSLKRPSMAIIGHTGAKQYQIYLTTNIKHINGLRTKLNLNRININFSVYNHIMYM